MSNLKYGIWKVFQNLRNISEQNFFMSNISLLMGPILSSIVKIIDRVPYLSRATGKPAIAEVIPSRICSSEKLIYLVPLSE